MGPQKHRMNAILIGRFCIKLRTCALSMWQVDHLSLLGSRSRRSLPYHHWTGSGLRSPGIRRARTHWNTSWRRWTLEPLRGPIGRSWTSWRASRCHLRCSHVPIVESIFPIFFVTKDVVVVVVLKAAGTKS